MGDCAGRTTRRLPFLAVCRGEQRSLTHFIHSLARLLLLAMLPFSLCHHPGQLRRWLRRGRSWASATTPPSWSTSPTQAMKLYAVDSCKKWCPPQTYYCQETHFYCRNIQTFSYIFDIQIDWCDLQMPWNMLAFPPSQDSNQCNAMTILRFE